MFHLNIKANKYLALQRFLRSLSDSGTGRHVPVSADLGLYRHLGTFRHLMFYEEKNIHIINVDIKIVWAGILPVVADMCRSRSVSARA